MADPTATAPAPDYEAQQADLLKQEQSATADYTAQRDKLQAQADAATAPLQQGVLDASKSLSEAASADADPKNNPAPLPPNLAKHLDPKVLSDTASAFMAVGALFGLLTRQPLTAALGNMTAAMKGVQEGDAAQYDRAMAEYKTNVEAAEKQAKAQIERRKQILDDKNLDLTGKLQALNIEEAAVGGPLRNLNLSFNSTMDMFKQRETALKNMTEHNDKILAAAERVQEHRDREQDIRMRMEESRQRLAELHGNADANAGPPVDYSKPLTLGDSSGRMVNAYKELLYGDRAFVGYNGSDRKPMRADAAKLGQMLGLSPIEQAVLPSSTSMKVKAADAMTKWNAFVDKSAQVIQLDLNNVIETSRKVNPDSLKAINNAVLAGKTQFNDGNATAYALAVNKLNTEYIRLQQGPTSNAMLHVDAAKTAEELLNKGISTESWEGPVKDIILSEMQNTKQGAQAVLTDLMDQIKAPVSGQAGNVAAPAKPALPSGWTVKVH